MGVNMRQKFNAYQATRFFKSSFVWHNRASSTGMFQKELDFSSREGLPDSCHFYTVSGSSLPDKTSVSSLFDQTKLQAMVSDSCQVADTASGQNLLSFLFSRHKSVGKWACPTIQNKLVMGSLLPLDLQSSGMAIHNKRQACGFLRPITCWTTIANLPVEKSFQPIEEPCLHVPLIFSPGEPNPPLMEEMGVGFQIASGRIMLVQMAENIIHCHYHVWQNFVQNVLAICYRSLLHCPLK